VYLGNEVSYPVLLPISVMKNFISTVTKMFKMCKRTFDQNVGKYFCPGQTNK